MRRLVEVTMESCWHCEVCEAKSRKHVLEQAVSEVGELWSAGEAFGSVKTAAQRKEPVPPGLDLDLFVIHSNNRCLRHH